MKYKIPPEKQGHRPRISDGPQKQYTILLPEKTQLALLRAGSERIRKILNSFSDGQMSYPKFPD